jgi:hypothetical protein
LFLNLSISHPWLSFCSNPSKIMDEEKDDIKRSMAFIKRFFPGILG